MNRARDCIVTALAVVFVMACGPTASSSDASTDAAQTMDVATGPDAGPGPDVTTGLDAPTASDTGANDAPAAVDQAPDTPPPTPDTPSAPDTPPVPDAPESDVAPSDGGAGHVVFISSMTVTGNFGGLAGGDALCQRLADAAGRAGRWRAILSDSTTDAVARITVTGPIRDTTGALIATGAADLWDGSIAAPIARTEGGATVPVSTSNTYTGTRADGRRDSSIMDTTWCNNWSGTEGGVQTGSSVRNDARWIELSTASGGRCDLVRRLYCISQ